MGHGGLLVCELNQDYHFFLIIKEHNSFSRDGNALTLEDFFFILNIQ